MQWLLKAVHAGEVVGGEGAAQRHSNLTGAFFLRVKKMTAASLGATTV
jgi:hypothetical protein